MRHSFVELSTLNIALLRRQPKFSKNPTFPFVFLLYFISFWFNLIFFFFYGFLVCFDLFDLCVKCFRFRQESKVGVDLLVRSVQNTHYIPRVLVCLRSSLYLNIWCFCFIHNI